MWSTCIKLTALYLWSVRCCELHSSNKCTRYNAANTWALICCVLSDLPLHQTSTNSIQLYPWKVCFVILWTWGRKIISHFSQKKIKIRQQADWSRHSKGFYNLKFIHISEIQKSLACSTKIFFFQFGYHWLFCHCVNNGTRNACLKYASLEKKILQSFLK